MSTLEFLSRVPLTTELPELDAMIGPGTYKLCKIIIDDPYSSPGKIVGYRLAHKSGCYVEHRCTELPLAFKILINGLLDKITRPPSVLANPPLS